VARRAGWYVTLTLVVVLAISACGAASPDSPPSGVDELVIPTPSPDPGDFVRGVDNPWLPLAPGATWRYRVSGAVEGTLVVTVEDTTYDVAGVATTPVRRTEPTGEETLDYYAEDRLGNVWWFGREGVWLAGRDGAEAGLAMPATPRLGDGWRAASAPGVAETLASVVTTDQSATTPAGRFTRLVGLDLTSPLDDDSSQRVFYGRGLGLVMEVSTSGPVYLAELESAPR
jgi:hypothetical protein